MLSRARHGGHQLHHADHQRRQAQHRAGLWAGQQVVKLELHGRSRHRRGRPHRHQTTALWPGVTGPLRLQEVQLQAPPLIASAQGASAWR